MTARRVIVPGAMPSRDQNGRNLPAKLRFFEPDAALDTLKAVYSDEALTTPFSQPILSDAAGRFPAIWADDAETFDVTWSDQTFDKLIRAWANLSPLDDAVLASVALAESAAEDAEDAKGAAETAQAASEAAQAAAEAAQLATENLAGASIVGALSVGTRAAWALTSIPTQVRITGIRTTGYATVGDGGAGLYKYAASEPSHAGKFQSADGAWWELSEVEPNPRMFGAKGDWNGTTGTLDTTALQNAIDYAAAKLVKVKLTAGKYLTNYLTLPAGVFIEGEGWTDSVLIQNESSGLGSIGTLYANSGSSSSRLGPMTFRDFGIEGRVATLGFEEFTHLASLNGVEDVLFERVRFYGFRGDGLYLGSGVTEGDERHNRRIKVRDCLFDGVNKDNRQGISILDVDGLTISGCKFQNITRSNMPGAIDFEPNSGNTFAVLKNISIEDNSFENIGGNVGTIAVVVADGIAVPTNLIISGNTQTGNGTAFLFVHTFRTPAGSDRDAGIIVENNVSRSGIGGPFLLYGIKGLTLRGNLWQDLDSAAAIGETYACRNVRITDTFERVGAGIVCYGVAIYGGAYLNLSGSVFLDCGKNQAGRCGIFFAAGTTSYVQLNDLTFASPAGQMSDSILKGASHTFTPATNQFLRCVAIIGSNQFQAHESDSIWTAYTPTVYGGSTAGTGTYTTQEGRFRRMGKQVFVEAVITQTAHTGTGQAYLSLPYTELGGGADSGISFAAQPLVSDQASSSNLVGLMIAGSQPRVQLYTYVSGNISPQAVDSGGATYYYRATYQMA